MRCDQTNGPYHRYWLLVFVSIHNHSSSMNSATRTHVAMVCVQSLSKHTASIQDRDYRKAHARWRTLNVYKCVVCVRVCEKVTARWRETERYKERRTWVYEITKHLWILPWLVSAHCGFCDISVCESVCVYACVMWSSKATASITVSVPAGSWHWRFFILCSTVGGLPQLPQLPLKQHPLCLHNNWSIHTVLSGAPHTQVLTGPSKHGYLLSLYCIGVSIFQYFSSTPTW